jgi:hypothetical protein
VEHFGPEPFESEVGRVMECAGVVRARLNELRCNTVKVYFGEPLDDENTSVSVYFIWQISLIGFALTCLIFIYLVFHLTVILAIVNMISIFR